MQSDGWCARALCMQHSTHPPFAPHRSHPCSNRSCMGQSPSPSEASTTIDQRRCAASHFPALKPTVSRPRQCQRLTCNLATAFSCPMPHPVWQDGRSEFDKGLRLWHAELSLLLRSPPTPWTRPSRPPRSRRAPISTPRRLRAAHEEAASRPLRRLTSCWTMPRAVASMLTACCAVAS